MNPESPEPERDRKASNAKTTVGQIAAAAGVTGTRTVGRASTENARLDELARHCWPWRLGTKVPACGLHTMVGIEVVKELGAIAPKLTSEGVTVCFGYHGTQRAHPPAGLSPIGGSEVSRLKFVPWYNCSPSKA